MAYTGTGQGMDCAVCTLENGMLQHHLQKPSCVSVHANEEGTGPCTCALAYRRWLRELKALLASASRMALASLAEQAWQLSQCQQSVPHGDEWSQQLPVYCDIQDSFCNDTSGCLTGAYRVNRVKSKEINYPPGHARKLDLEGLVQRYMHVHSLGSIDAVKDNWVNCLVIITLENDIRLSK